MQECAPERAAPKRPSLPRIRGRLVDARLEAVSHGSARGVLEELRAEGSRQPGASSPPPCFVTSEC